MPGSPKLIIVCVLIAGTGLAVVGARSPAVEASPPLDVAVLESVAESSLRVAIATHEAAPTPAAPIAVTFVEPARAVAPKPAAISEAQLLAQALRALAANDPERALALTADAEAVPNPALAEERD